MKGVRLITHRLGVAHFYNCIPVLQQFHQIELRVKNLKIQLNKENKCKKKKMKNEMLKRDTENRFNYQMQRLNFQNIDPIKYII